MKFEYSKVQCDSVMARIELKGVRGRPIHLANFSAGAAPVFRHIRARWEKWVVDKRE